MSEYSPLNHADYLSTARSVAKEAGKILKSAFYANPSSILKNENHADLVTATDRQIELYIFSELRQHYPTFEFIGEENVSQAEEKSVLDKITNAPTWVVDPIDGTTNFVHGVPSVCICIALVENQIPKVGVVYNPILEDEFYGVIGQGAFLSNPLLPVNSETGDNVFRLPLRNNGPLGPLSNMLVVTEYGSDLRLKTVSAKTDILNAVIVNGPVRGARGWGTAAIDMCHIARGSCDVYWEAGLHVWDFAAAAVIVRESGGVVVNWTNRDPTGKVKDEGLQLGARNILVVRTGTDAEIEKVVGEIRNFLDLTHIELI
ncbi:Inositol monophosphatase 2 [Nowakowskiella sp. JEL0407]|nr:Inositol monophosphatase 2 [Nowakowskiella sp. JEL0407]